MNRNLEEIRKTFFQQNTQKTVLTYYRFRLPGEVPHGEPAAQQRHPAPGHPAGAGAEAAAATTTTSTTPPQPPPHLHHGQAAPAGQQLSVRTADDRWQWRRRRRR